MARIWLWKLQKLYTIVNSSYREILARQSSYRIQAVTYKLLTYSDAGKGSLLLRLGVT